MRAWVKTQPGNVFDYPTINEWLLDWTVHQPMKWSDWWTNWTWTKHTEIKKKLKKNWFKPIFLRLIVYMSTIILELFFVILAYFFGIDSCKLSLTREYSTCHLKEMWISPSFLGWIIWSNALNIVKNKSPKSYYNVITQRKTSLDWF